MKWAKARIILAGFFQLHSTIDDFDYVSSGQYFVDKVRWYQWLSDVLKKDGEDVTRVAPKQET